MIIRGASLFSRAAAFFAILFTLAACGGGGGGDSFLGDSNNQRNLRITLLDPDGNETRTISGARPGTLQISGAGSGVLVTATTTVGILSPESETALTNSNGVAVFEIRAEDELGAGTITATAIVDDETVEGRLDFQVVSSGELILTLLDANGNKTETLSSLNPGELQVFVDSTNNTGVSVNLEATLGAIIPASGSVLSDANGIATFFIEANGDKGAGQFTATALVNGVTLNGTLNYQVIAGEIRIGSFDDTGTFIEGRIEVFPESAVSASGAAQISVDLIDADDQKVLTPTNVFFTSGCVVGGLSTITPENPVVSVNGTAIAQYAPAGCFGVDQITANLEDSVAEATADITIAEEGANAVTFVSAEPQLIVLRGTGGAGRDETSNVTFRVVDRNDQPLPLTRVEFSLSTNVGGISLSPAFAITDQDGRATTVVSSGDVATVVRVIATVADGINDPVATVSDVLTVTTGLPDQNSISLSVSDTFVVEDGMRVDGIERTFTVSMADKFNNPVVDGTPAVFTTEYGAIVGSCFTTGGTCSVNWRSQAPRFPTITDLGAINTIFDADYNCPSHNASSGPCQDDLGFTRGARSTILVHAIGEESFVDRNGNGIMDREEADLFDNLPEAFVDHNEDGVYTPNLDQCLASPLGSPQCIAGNEEIFIDFNANEVYDTNDDPPLYNGLLCPPEGDDDWCSRDLVHVFDDIVVALSDSPSWDILLLSGRNPVERTTFGVTHTALIADTFNTPPPGGSTVQVTTNGDCELLSDNSFTVPNFFRQGAYSIPVLTVAPTNPDGTPGTVKITLNPIGQGGPYSETFACDRVPTDEPLDCDFSPQPPGCPD